MTKKGGDSIHGAQNFQLFGSGFAHCPFSRRFGSDVVDKAKKTTQKCVVLRSVSLILSNSDRLILCQNLLIMSSTAHIRVGNAGASGRECSALAGGTTCLPPGKLHKFFQQRN